MALKADWFQHHPLKTDTNPPAELHAREAGVENTVTKQIL